MDCPKCSTSNVDENSLCILCGEPLNGTIAPRPILQKVDLGNVKLPIWCVLTISAAVTIVIIAKIIYWLVKIF